MFGNTPAEALPNIHHFAVAGAIMQIMSKPRILYVDDEEINLSNFQMAFENDFEVLTAISGLDGLKLFKTHSDIAVIVADQRMPDINGVEMLTRIYKSDPDPIRIILTAYIDPDDIILAINQGHIHQYINKPWNIERVRVILNQAVEKYNLTRENKRLLYELADKNRALKFANQQLADDLDLRERLEQKNREAEIKMMSQAKLASLGQIATGMAHEINQPLTYIKIVLESTARDLTEHNLNEEELQKDLQESQHQISRITDIIDHLRTFGSNNNNDLEQVSLPAALDGALILFNEKIRRKGINLKLDIPNQLPPITANLCKLEQIFTNLLQNSIDALEGTVNPSISISFQHKNNQLVTKFSDSGKGLGIDTPEKIFEPFFTTKETGKGTGLGLSIVYGIVNELKGSIEYQAPPKQGCSFLIYLPVSTD